ncbi:alpha/beta hydrolase [Nannocystis pusilla]|uniref:alpha/beta hydrolase n=1 Tax=Nannocystis pusilla TaxID=889268 RepID=UPI003BF23866
MKVQLMFVHGRSQGGEDSIKLKRKWVEALYLGFAAAGLSSPIADTDIRFPYYGDTLDDLLAGADEVAQVVLRGPATDAGEQAFAFDVLREVQAKVEVSDAQVRAEGDEAMVERGVLNSVWVLQLLRAIDRHVPGASALGIALATSDVYHYLENSGARDTIEEGIRRAISPGVPTVVIGHSLGSVVAYNMLRREGSSLGWKVPLFVTLGSPLGVTEIRSRVRPHQHPDCVGHWLNVLDPQDLVALYPLDTARFDVNPPIENVTDLINDTPNHHGIRGYLSDAMVARRIHEALTARS